MLIQTHKKADEMSSTECVGRTAAVGGHMTVRAGNAEIFQTVLTETSYLSLNNLMNPEEKSNWKKSPEANTEEPNSSEMDANMLH